MPSPTFLLCVGAQKAGTTWLHRYVSADDGAAAALMKEFHVWSTLYATAGEPPILFEGQAAPRRHALHDSMVERPELYFDYFSDLLERDGKWLATDMTPAYAGLPAEAFGRIASGFKSRGIAVRVVFLMRDPVERCWSAVRMYRQKRLPVPGVGAGGGEEAALRAYCRTAHARQHGRYDRTVTALERAFPADRIHFGFYENMFSEGSLRALSSFIGIEPKPDFLDRQLNVSPKSAELSPDTYRIVAEAYSDALAFCGERFPVTRTLWKSFDALP